MIAECIAFTHFGLRSLPDVYFFVIAMVVYFVNSKVKTLLYGDKSEYFQKKYLKESTKNKIIYCCISIALFVLCMKTGAYFFNKYSNLIHPELAPY